MSEHEPVLEPVYPLETQRLLLRPYAESDFDAVYAIQSRPEVARWAYWEPRNEDEVRANLELKIGSSAVRSEGDFLALAAVLKDTGELVGECHLQWISAEHRQGEIGFAFNPDHQGHGYATEASRVFLRLGFEELGLHRIVGRLEPRNAASARVLEKLGMRREAHLVENEFVKGEWQSELVYAILDREWHDLAAPGGASPAP